MKKTITGMVAALLFSWTITAFAPANYEVTPEEAEGLQKMREEEKLAHDVYIALNEKWQIPAFYNIAQSEQRHTEAIASLMEDYKLEDPALAEAGQFSNPELQQLYDELVSKGKQSLVDALKVGATIEDLDIADLDKLLAETDDENIRFVYNNLNRGSENHLRTFQALLKDEDVVYTPVHLSQNRFDEIIAGDGGNRNRKNGQMGMSGKGQRCDNNRTGRNCGRGNKSFNKSCRSNNKNFGRKGRSGRF
jgi:hypothetical protein